MRDSLVMKAKNYLFIVGDNPYENGHGEKKGNGSFFTTAANLEEALPIIFGDLDYPGEATGRKVFVPGISLPLHEDEVIQVWTDIPEVVAASNKIIKGLGGRFGRGGYHNGRGSDLGLACEIPVRDLDKFITPVRALLTAPEAPGNPEKQLSPLGASVVKYHEVKHEIKLAAQRQKMEVMRKKWDFEKIEEEMKEKMNLMNQQIGVFDAYLHGTRHRTQMCRGKKSTGRYMVYQQRVFLSEEVSLLGNFADMDFKDMEKFEKWLVQSGHIWKLLPHERCILATRIRQEKKDYGNPLANLWNNMANMQNMIWIRDGENVFHVDVEFDFHNAIFPHRDQFDRAKTVVQDGLFTKGFKHDEHQRDWRGDKIKNPEVMGQMKHKPLDEDEPYFTRRNLHKKFKTMEDWLNDPECYTELLDKQINEAVHNYLRDRNKKQMIFAVIIQGVVDNTNFLDIPKGTDMFNWESVNQHMELLYDYSHGLPFQGWADKVAPFINGKVTAGDWIVAEVDEYIDSGSQWRKGKTYKESRPMLFKVLGLEEIEETYLEPEPGSREYKKRIIKRPCVRYHPKVSRHSYALSYEENQKRRNQAGIKLVLKSSTFIRVPMSPQYAKDILNDRDWKKAHKDLVPLMVNYGVIIQAMKTPVNGTVIKWDNYDE